MNEMANADGAFGGANPGPGGTGQAGGGLLGTCAFDLGYHPAWTHELAELHDAEPHGLSAEIVFVPAASAAS